MDAGSGALQGPNPFAPPFRPTFTLSRDDGKSFDFLSLDVFQADLNGLGVPITFIGSLAGGGIVQFVAHTPEYGRTSTSATRTSITLPDTFRRLGAVSWANGAEWHQFDNVLVNGSVGAVPEPGT
jgi:hypothetical protein